MTFTNSILAGTTLVRQSIKSENFVAGSAGWRIQRDGDAEFNSGQFRGSVIITGSNDAIRINDDPAWGVTIEFENSNGNTYLHTYGVLFGYDYYQQTIGDNSGTGVGTLQWHSNDTIGWSNRASSQKGVLFEKESGRLIVNDGSVTVSTAYNNKWHILSLKNGWSARSGYITPAVREGPDGLLYIFGDFNVGTTGSPIVAASITQSDLIPSQQAIVTMIGPNGTAETRINTNGNVEVYGNPGNVATLNGAVIPLAGYP